MNSTPKVTVIIPSRNEGESIAGCLKDIFSQEVPEGGFEVIVADGMSNDNTRVVLNGMVGSYPDLRVIDNPGKIVSTGLNAAISAARGDIIIRMDAHSSYEPDYLRQCVAELEKTHADNVGGPWVARGTNYLSKAIAAAFQNPLVVGGARGHDPDFEGQVDTVYLGCWRKEAFMKFGYFDEELVRNQDDEFNLRIIRGGGSVWQSPRIKSQYHPRNSLKALFRQYTQYGYWKVRVIQKHRLPASLRHLIPGGFVSALLLFLPLAFFFVWAKWALVFVTASYCLNNALASVTTAAKSKWSYLPVLPAVVVCFQLGYGFGFLRGLMDFVLFRQKASTQFTRLTRDSGPHNSP